MRHLFTTLCLVLVVLFTCSVVVSAEESIYKVERGDSLWKIAQKHQVNLDDLININGLKSDLIYSGTVLKLPQKKNNQRASHTKQTSSASLTYHVQKGDNLWMLARTYQTTVTDIKQANGLKNDLILVGQRLQLPRTQKSNTVQAASLSAKNTQSKSIRASTPSDEDYKWLARIIEAEAGNQSYLGKLAVASVVMNRKNDDQFPDTVKEVIFQKGQFTPVANGRIHKVKPSEDSLKAAREALEGANDPTEGALFFYNPKIAKDKWIRTREVIKDIDQHRFAL